MFLRRTPAAPAASLSLIGACCVLCRVCVLLDPKLTHTCPCEASIISLLLLFYFICRRVSSCQVRATDLSPLYDTSPATSDFMQAFFFLARLFASNSTGARSKFELDRCLLRFVSGVRVVGPETLTHMPVRGINHLLALWWNTRVGTTVVKSRTNMPVGDAWKLHFAHVIMFNPDKIRRSAIAPTERIYP